MISDAAGTDQHAVLIAQDTTEVLEKTWLEFGSDHWLAMLRAEDEMKIQARE